MKVIHVARKPLIGTVAKNALEHGTGGINIDKSRIGTIESLDGGAYAKNPSPRPNPEEWRFKRGGARSKLPGDTRGEAAAGMYAEGSQVEGEFSQPSGRWPANLILQHKPGCKNLGPRRIEGHVIRRYEGDGANRSYGFYIPNEDNRGAEQKHLTVEKQPDTVKDIYECVPDCPCVMLDEQTGSSKSTGGRIANISKSSHVYGGGKGIGQDLAAEDVRGDPGYGDVGGASRFFKQVGGGPINPPVDREGT